jgi:uncharacterized protein (DUF305 family)
VLISQHPSLSPDAQSKVMKPGQRGLVLLVLVSTLNVTVPTQEAQRDNAATESSWSELIASIDKMHVAMNSVKPSGNSDIDFVALMIPHHQAAIAMAKSQLLNGKNPQIRRLAQEVITDQQSEIELMQAWMKQHQPGK